MAQSFDAVMVRLSQAKRVAIFTHQRPDADAIGCQVAMGLLLVQLGKQVTVMQDEAPPPTLRFLHQELGSLRVGTIGQGDLSEFDTILVVDTCVYGQMESAREWLKPRFADVVVLDHHLSCEAIGPTVYSDTGASACAEIVAELIRAMGQKISSAMARVLMAGLVGDCGWFRFDSVTPRTHRIAADLIEAGAKPAELYELMVQTEQPAKLALMQRALGSITWSADHRVAVMMVRQSDFAATGALPSHTEGLVNIPLDVASVTVCALLTEMPDGRVRGSLRSKHQVDVNKVANSFGGGGHAKAAGLKLDGPIDAAAERVMAALQAAV